MSISLAARKDIKEYEPKLQEHLKTIERASGILFETEFDWPTLALALEKRAYKDKLGEVFYSWYIGGLVSKIESFCQDSIQKESFVETFGTAKRLSFEIYDEAVGVVPSRTRNDNGTLVLGCPMSYLCTSTDDIGWDLSQTCTGDSVLSVGNRKNIQDNEGTRKRNIARIAKASGIEFELEVDWPGLSKAATANGFEDTIGEMVYDTYLGYLATNIQDLCKDDLTKEAFVEACQRKTLSFIVAPPEKGGYGDCHLEDGVLFLSLVAGNIGYSPSDVGRDIEEQL